jgi:hypothetical protein
MDIEFHYHITFILCRKAGFSPDDSFKIAYSSQYTDDNTYHYHVNLKGGHSYLNQISQTLDITKPSEKRKTIYPLFHFIPGGEEAAESCCFDCGEKDCFVTIANSLNSQYLFDEALKAENLYRIGIAIHAFADTWAHQNFIGYKDKLNAQKGLGYKIIPNIGHADFVHEPDKIHNRWYDGRLRLGMREIDNDERFLQAAKQIYLRLYLYNHPGSGEHQAVAEYENQKLEKLLLDAMDEAYLWGSSEHARRKAYQKICPELKLDKYHYDSNAWRYGAIEKKEIELDIFDKYWGKENFLDSDWYKFQKAVEDHRDLALDRFLPFFKQAGFPVYE